MATQNLRWKLVGLTTLFVAAMEAVLLAQHGPGEEFLRSTLRATARSSVALLLGAYVASSAFRLWRGALPGWLLRHRRYLGVSFAVSHTVHASAVIALYPSMKPEEAGVLTVIVGGAGFVFMWAMAATSFDRSAAWLGPVWWKRLHSTGLQLLWFVFAFTFLGVATQGGVAGIAGFVLLVAALGVRIVARLRQRDAAPAQPETALRL